MMHSFYTRTLSWNQEQLVLALQHEAEHLSHVDVARRLPRRQLPVEAMHEVRQHRLHGRDAKVHPGAHPAPGTEGQEPEVGPPEVDARRAAAGAAVEDEPLGGEGLRVLPEARVRGDGPGVDQDAQGSKFRRNFAEISRISVFSVVAERKIRNFIIY